MKSETKNEKRESAPMRRRKRVSSAGFTLVEMIVAVGLFAIVMTVSVGALLALVTANRKAQAMQSVVNNLNIALDGMIRKARMGTVYHCGLSGATAGLKPVDCGVDGSDTFAFEPLGKTAADSPWVYRYNATTHRIDRSADGGAFLPITAPEVTITDMKFYVVGSCPVTPPPAYACTGDTLQPKVVIVVKGEVNNAGSAAYSTFHVEATAVQRQLDL